MSKKQFDERVDLVRKGMEDAGFFDDADPLAGGLFLTWQAVKPLKSMEDFTKGFRLSTAGGLEGDPRIAVVALDHFFRQRPELFEGLIKLNRIGGIRHVATAYSSSEEES